MRVLGLDLSVRRTGWAFGEIGAIPTLGSIRFAPESARPPTVWFEAFKWFMRTFEELNPDIVAMEAAFAGGNFTDAEGKPVTSMHTHGVLWGLQSTIQMAAESRFQRELLQKPALLVYESTAKKILTGRGRWSKEEGRDAGKKAVKRRCIQLGWATEKNVYDETDAAAVWAAAACKVDPKFASDFTLLGTSGTRQAAEEIDVGF